MDTGGDGRITDMTRREQEAYYEGYDAYSMHWKDPKYGNNPYDSELTPNLHRMWKNGWIDAENEDNYWGDQYHGGGY